MQCLFIPFTNSSGRNNGNTKIRQIHGTCSYRVSEVFWGQKRQRIIPVHIKIINCVLQKYMVLWMYIEGETDLVSEVVESFSVEEITLVAAGGIM